MKDEAPAKPTKYDQPLREFEDLKHALAESTIVAVTDTEGKITYANDHFCRISKYSREELLGQDHRIVNSGYHSKEFFADLWKTISDGEIWRGEIRNKAKDGSFYWVATTIVPFFDESGNLYKYTAIRHDITKQKETEEILRDQRELIEQTYDASYIWNLDDGIIYWNKKAEQLYGYTFDEIKGREVCEFLRTEYPISVRDYFEQLKRDGHWEGEIKQITKSGKELVLESRQVITHKFAKHPIVLETCRNITSQKLARERIRQQASLLDKTRDAILVCDLNHKIIFWNKGAERAYGWRAEDVLGEDICKVVCHGDQSVIERAILALEKSDEWQEEAVNYTKSGKELTVISRWTLVRNELGQPDYFLVVNTDISNLKSAEHQLFRAQRLESIGTLAGGIAHDLNNALSPILMSVEMLQNELNLPASSKPWLTVIRENTERGADLIKQVLMYARGAGESSRVVLQPRPLIKELVQILKQTFPQNIEIKLEIEPDIPGILADPTQTNQVLMNLAVNAKDAMTSGGTLEICVTGTTVDEGFAKMNPGAEPGMFLLVTVSDTGTGMAANTVKRMWDPFFTTKEVGKGTGLGLSTALSIVEGHGGFIEAHSVQGSGTTFSVYFPAIEGSPAEDHLAVNTNYARGKGEVILVIDDEEDILQVTSAALQKYGFKVFTARDGKKALEVFSQDEKIDLVLTDMAMPFMDGPSTIRALRKIDPELKIIATSGLAGAGDARGEDLGVNKYLPKPFTTETLLDLITEVLSG